MFTKQRTDLDSIALSMAKIEKLNHSMKHCLRRHDTKESTCLLRHITAEKSGLCQYAVCIAQNTTLKSNKH